MHHGEAVPDTREVGGVAGEAGRLDAQDRLDAFEERAAIAEHDGGLTREDAERLAAGEQGFARAAELLAACATMEDIAEAGGLKTGEARVRDDAAAANPETDAEALLAHLRAAGPATYGAAARATGMGVSHAWRAEARLRAGGLVKLRPFGRACPMKTGQ